MFRNKIRALLVAAALVVIAMLAPAGAQAAKKSKKLPRIAFAVAVYEQVEGQVGVAVKVENATNVTIVYQGATRDAAYIPPTNFWWSTEFNGGQQDCYRIAVTARNQHGKISRQLGAGRLGTGGCADCSDAETAVARAQHKVKHAKRALRRADSPRKKQHARHRLAKAEKRLTRAEHNLQVCMA